MGSTNEMVMRGSLRPLAKCGKPTAVTLPSVQALKAVLLELNLSHATLARRIKVTTRTVGRWLSGERPVAIESLINDAEIGMVFSSRLTVILAEQVRRAA